MSAHLGKHVALIGFMGSGKSTVGPRLAHRLGVSFADTDRLVEELVGARIPQIFEREGEQAFRDYETKALVSALAGSHRVIATGGGIVGREENWRLLVRDCVTIWLRVPLPDLLERLKSDTDRPLLRDDPGFARVQALYEAREKLYMRASMWIDASVPPMQVVQDILDRLQSGLGTESVADEVES